MSAVMLSWMPNRLSLGSRTRRSVRLILITAALVGLVSFAPPPVAAEERPFQIGFLREGSDFARAPVLMQELADYLRRQEPLITAMRRAGYDPERIVLSQCDGPRDMVQRMGLGEFELALATAVVYARQQGPYAEPILQTRLQGDFKPPGQQVGYQRRGVVFMGPACSLFASEPTTPTRSTIARKLAQDPMAVPSSDSAAGYIYPRLEMANRYGVTQPGNVWFCLTDAEVVKHVVAGLAPLGACREGALMDLIPPEKRGLYYRTLFRTPMFPTDPILLRDDLRPAQSDLGVELKASLRRFFNTVQKTAAGLRIENASGRDYEDLARKLDEFETVRQTPSLLAPKPRPTPRLEPALPILQGGGQ